MQTFHVEIKGSEVKGPGIFADADDDLFSRCNSLRQILIDSDYRDVPTIPTPDSTIIQEIGLSTIGIWIMPDNQIPGMLEHFMIFLLPDVAF